MERRFIVDKEINLNDYDFLKTKGYADSLTEVIKNAEDNKVFIIGIFGSWGTGKSSIIETARTNIETDKKFNIKFIIYDAWKYSSDSFRRMFLLKVQKELCQEQTDEMARFYQSENTEIKLKHIFNFNGLLIIIAAILIVIIDLVFSIRIIEHKAPFISIITLLGLLIPLLNTFFHNLKSSINKPPLFAPEQFEECFKQLMNISLKNENNVIKVTKKNIEYVKRAKVTMTSLDKIVIVIDNIDRCHSEMAYQLLTDIKTFLCDESHNIIFVVPVDDQSLIKDLPNNENFLRKLFNVVLRIKPYQTTEMQIFARELNKRYNLKFNNDTLSLATKEFATNPRRIIQLFNNLSLTLTLYERDFAIQNEALICAILILREEYFDFYEKITKNINYLKEEYLPGDNDELNSFMRIACLYFNNSDPSDILKILTNTKASFSSIPNEIQEAVRTNDIKNVVLFIEKNAMRKIDIIQLIHHNILEESKYESELQMTNWLNFVSQLSEKISLERAELIKFDNEIKQYYKILVSKTIDANCICRYANLLFNSGLCNLKNIIIQYLKKEDKENSEIYNNYAKAVLTLFNSEDDTDSLIPFAEKYFAENPINEDVAFTPYQKMYLFTDNIIKAHFTSYEKLNENNRLKNLLWLFKNKPNILIDTYNIFISYTPHWIGEMKYKTKDQIISYINFLIPFLATINDRIFEFNTPIDTSIDTLIAKLFGSRTLQNQLSPDNPYRDTQVQLIDECNEKESEILIDFLIHTFRIFNSYDSIINNLSSFASRCLSSLASRCPQYLNFHLRELLNKNISIHPMFDIILANKDYSSENATILLKHCLTQKNIDGSRYISNEKILFKLKSLLDNITNTNISRLLNELIADYDIKKMIISELKIYDRNPKFIIALPPELFNLVAEILISNIAKNFHNNSKYLSIIAEKANDSQKSKLVKILLEKIASNQYIEIIFSILNTIKISRYTDIDLILTRLDAYIKTTPNTNKNLKLMDHANELIAKFKPLQFNQACIWTNFELPDCIPYNPEEMTHSIYGDHAHEQNKIQKNGQHSKYLSISSSDTPERENHA
jgi:hypothetical protein